MAAEEAPSEILKIGIDLGNVASVKLPGKPYDYPLWQHADPSGSYPFMLLYAYKNGGDGLVFITCTKQGTWYVQSRHGQEEAWVVRFLRSMGVEDMGVPLERNLSVCKTHCDKGPLATQHNISAMIDDHYDCLLHVHRALPECKLLCYSNSEWGYVPPSDPNEAEDSFWGAVEHHEDWKSLAQKFDLHTLPFPGSSFDEVWEQLLLRGPPNKPHSMTNLRFVEAACNTHVPRPPQTPPPDSLRVPRQPQAPPPDSLHVPRPHQAHPPNLKAVPSTHLKRERQVSQSETTTSKKLLRAKAKASESRSSSSGSVMPPPLAVTVPRPSMAPAFLEQNLPPLDISRIEALTITAAVQAAVHAAVPNIIGHAVQHALISRDSQAEQHDIIDEPISEAEQHDIAEEPISDVGQHDITEEQISDARQHDITEQHDITSARRKGHQPSTAERWAAASTQPHSAWMEKKRARAKAYLEKKNNQGGAASAPMVISPKVFCVCCGGGEPGKYCIFICCTHCCPHEFEGRVCPQH